MSHAAFTWHGGRLAEACAHFGGDPEDWIDLSTGINSMAWPGASAITPDWRHLPDPAALSELEEIAALYFGVDPAMCCALPGSEIGLRLLGQVFDLPGAYLAPTYRTHTEICALSAEHNYSRFEASLLLLANPNNPDGRIVRHTQLTQWLDGQERVAGWLVVDEAFADVTPNISVASQVSDCRRLIVLRSFGKFFGLAGVRLGFVLAPRTIIARFRRLLGEWPLSVAALAIGSAAYADTEWIAAARGELFERAAQLDDLLQARGFEPKGDCPLFRLVETQDAYALFERLAHHSILTRPFSDNPRWLRLGVPAGEGKLMRLDRALALG